MHPKSGELLRQAQPNEVNQPDMYPGQYVRIIGLRTQQGLLLNGKEGKNRRFDMLMGRWLVEVGAPSEGRSCTTEAWLKAFNLVPCVRRNLAVQCADSFVEKF